MSYGAGWMLFLALLMVSCKEDSNVSDAASQVEQDYFQDYESPKEKWGFINEKGKEVIEPIYDMVKDMKTDLVAANYKGRWGYIDNNGKKVIPFLYKQAYDMLGSTAFVQDFNNQWLLIDETNQVIDSCNYDQIVDHDENLAIVKYRGLKGIVNRTDGSQVYKPEFQDIIPVTDGYIVAKDGSYGLIQKGELVLEYAYDKIYPPQNGLYKVKKDGRYAFVDAISKKQSPNYDNVTPYHYNATVVKTKQGYALIDKNFKVIKQLNYDKVTYAGEEKWKYKQSGRWGLLDARGKELCQARYTLMNRFQEDRIVAARGDNWGYLDEQGEIAVSFKYPLVWDFHKGKARVISRRGIGFIDQGGKLVVSDRFFEVRDFYRGKARFQTF